MKRIQPINQSVNLRKTANYLDNYRVLATIGALFRDTKPYLFFSIVSIFLLALGGILFFPILRVYFETGLVDRYPTLIMVSGIWVIAIISYFSGVVLQVLKNQQRQNFERYLNLMEEIRNVKKQNIM
jgi:hypothetical protein